MGTTLVNSSRSANAGKREGGGREEMKGELKSEKRERERRHEMVRGEII